MDRLRQGRLQSYGYQLDRLEDGVKLLLAGKVFPMTRKYTLPISRNWGKIEHTVRRDIDRYIIFVDHDQFDKECQKRLLYAKELIQDFETYQEHHPDAKQTPPRSRLGNYIFKARGHDFLSYPETPLIEKARKDRHFSAFRYDIQQNYTKIKELPPITLEKSLSSPGSQPVITKTEPPSQEGKPQGKKPAKKKTPAKQTAKIIPFRRREPVE